MELNETYSVASNPRLEELKEQELCVLFAGESQTKPNHRLGPKIYDYYLLHHVLSGSGSFQTENRTFQLDRGASFLIAPGKLVSYSSDAYKPWRYRWIAFQGGGADKLLGTCGIEPHNPVFFPAKARRISAYLLAVQQSFRAHGAMAPQKALGYLQLTFAELGETLLPQKEQGVGHSEIESKVQMAVRYLSTQYAQEVSIEQMAENLGYNRAYLSRIFKQVTGASPASYLLKLRLEQSRRLLRERTELTIEQIAASVGFQDALYYSKQFKRMYRETPTAYRKKAAGANP